MYRRDMPGEKGWRSPLPHWWVDEANDRLKRRGLDKKQLARALHGKGHNVSEMMVLRALHPIEAKRLATLETLDAISDALGMPRPVVVAATFAQALELQAAVAFDAAAAARLRIESEIEHAALLQRATRSVVDGGDGRKRFSRDVDENRSGSLSAGPKTVRRAPRAR